MKNYYLVQHFFTMIFCVSIVLNISSCIGDAVKMMKEHKIGGIPIVDDKNLLLGIVTNRDIRFQKEMNLPIRDIMTSNNYNKIIYINFLFCFFNNILNICINHHI